MAHLRLNVECYIKNNAEAGNQIHVQSIDCSAVNRERRRTFVVAPTVYNRRNNRSGAQISSGSQHNGSTLLGGRLRNSPVYFLLLFGLLGMLTDCGGSGNGTNVPGTTTSAIGTQSQRLIAESATATPSGTYWSGTVSDISVNGIIANCGQSNFSEGYGCLPVVTTGAAITGTAQRGGYFQMWGDLSKLPNITATTINYASTAFPATAPSSSPSGTATAAAITTSGTFMSFSNAQDYPSTFVPYASGSVWNTPVSTHPTYLSSSGAIVAAQFPGGNNTQAIRANEAGVYDYSHPRYFASNADPVVALRCTLYCGAPDNGGVPATAHIPALARPALGSDAHIDVVQADGTEICAWGVTQPGANWATRSDTHRPEHRELRLVQ